MPSDIERIVTPDLQRRPSKTLAEARSRVARAVVGEGGEGGYGRR